MLKIAVPKPCNQPWENMEPGNDGRFCNHCAKKVVDFTLMNDEEVRHYLLSKQQEKVCGRFTAVQLNRITIDIPVNLFNMKMPPWKRFLVASLIVFSTTLFSCSTNYQGKVEKEKYEKDHPVLGITLPPPLEYYKGLPKPQPEVIQKESCNAITGEIAPYIQVMDKPGEVAASADSIAPITGTAVFVEPPIIKGEITQQVAKIDTVKLMGDTVIFTKPAMDDSCNYRKYE